MLEISNDKATITVGDKSLEIIITTAAIMQAIKNEVEQSKNISPKLIKIFYSHLVVRVQNKYLDYINKNILAIWTDQESMPFMDRMELGKDILKLEQIIDSRIKEQVECYLQA